MLRHPASRKETGGIDFSAASYIDYPPQPVWAAAFCIFLETIRYCYYSRTNRPLIVTHPAHLKVAFSEGLDAGNHHFIGSDAVQRGARPRE